MSEKFYQKFTENKKSKKEIRNMQKQKNAVAEKKIEKNSELKTLASEKKSYNRDRAKSSFLSYQLINSQFDLDSVPADAKKILEDFDSIVQGVRPLNSKQLQQLPDNIRNLSHQLTDQRSERRLGYMNENVQLSSYVRYYTWWNLVRLTRLFSNLPEDCFPQEKCICLDAGSGPLTVVTALWLARPELRKLDLTWYCLDVSSNSMAFGEDVYLSVAAKLTGNTWKIIRVKGPFGTFIKEKADFITCANMLNELDQAGDMPPEYQSKKYFEQFKAYASVKAKFLLIEPGVPKAARTLSLLRERFIKDSKIIKAPCPHAQDCPMNGFKAYTGSQNKWCNFAFSTDSAPEKLLKLSERAKLPKERATLTYLAVVPGVNAESEKKNKDVLLRIASDSFKIPGAKSGFYACSCLGLTLVKLMTDEKITSGDLLKVELKHEAAQLPQDQKSGAKIICIGNQL